MDRLYEANIRMNGQIVLCKGLNDKDELDYTIKVLSAYLPHMQSVSVVPVGLSKHREGLYPLEPFTKEDCLDVVNTVRRWQDQLYKEHGCHFIHLGDEFYIMAGLEVPEEDTYDGYLQLENGVGMTRLLIDTALDCIDAIDKTSGGADDDALVGVVTRRVTIATGMLIQPILERLMSSLMDKVPGLEVNVIGIRNDYFGEMITVSGLLVGSDILNQLKGKDLGDVLLLPDNILRSGEDILLDDVTLQALKNGIDVPVELVSYIGDDLVKAVVGDTSVRKQENNNE